MPRGHLGSKRGTGSMGLNHNRHDRGHPCCLISQRSNSFSTPFWESCLPVLETYDCCGRPNWSLPGNVQEILHESCIRRGWVPKDTRNPRKGGKIAALKCGAFLISQESSSPLFGAVLHPRLGDFRRCRRVRLAYLTSTHWHRRKI